MATSLTSRIAASRFEAQPLSLTLADAKAEGMTPLVVDGCRIGESRLLAGDQVRIAELIHERLESMVTRGIE